MQARSEMQMETEIKPVHVKGKKIFPCDLIAAER